MTTRFRAATWDRSRNFDELLDHPLEMESWDVLRLANGIDHDEERVLNLYLTVKIRELNGKTAQELVQKGEADLVIGFLRSIRRGYRD
jgi:hypothetical protein